MGDWQLLVKFSQRDPQQAALWGQVRAAMDDGTNVSALIRWLLAQHFGGQLVAAVPVAQAGPVDDDHEDPNDPLVRRAVGMDFTNAYK
jgi:hypothetical protein